jgi:hypothetical protein
VPVADPEGSLLTLTLVYLVGAVSVARIRWVR